MSIAQPTLARELASSATSKYERHKKTAFRRFLQETKNYIVSSFLRAFAAGFDLGKLLIN